MNFAQQLATDMTNVLAGKTAKVAGGKPAKQPKAAATPAKARSAASKAQQQATPPVAAGKPSAPAGTRYALGKAFVAKAGGKYAQAENWAVVSAMLPATREELITALKAAAEKGGYMDRENAVGFVGGRIRGGHIVVAE